MRGILHKYCPAHVLILHELANKNKIDYLLYQLRDLDGKHDMCTQKTIHCYLLHLYFIHKP